MLLVRDPNLNLILFKKQSHYNELKKYWCVIKRATTVLLYNLNFIPYPVKYKDFISYIILQMITHYHFFSIT